MADIKDKIVKFFRKIKEFIKGIILKIKVFFKNIGKEKVFKDVGDAIKQLTPEQRNKTVQYAFADFSKVGKGIINTSNLSSITSLADKILKADDETLETFKNKKPEDYIFTFGKSADEAKDYMDTQFSLQIKNATVVQAYNDITKMSNQIDALAKNLLKLCENLTKQADKLEGSVKSLKEDKPKQAKLIKNLVVPAMRSNTDLFKSMNKSVVDANKKILKDLIKLVKGNKSKNIELVKNTVKDFGLELKESYDPWAGLE